MKTKSSSSRGYSSLLLPALAFFLAGSSSADTVNWNATTSGSFTNNTGTGWNAVPLWNTTTVAQIQKDFTAAATFTLDGSKTLNKLTYDDTGLPVDKVFLLDPGTGGTLTFAGTTPTVTATAAAMTITVPVNLSAAGLTKAGAGTLTLTNTVTGFGASVYNNVNAGTLAIGSATVLDWTTVNKTTGSGVLRLDGITTTNIPAAFSVTAGELYLNPASGTFVFTNAAGFTQTGGGMLRLGRDAVGLGGAATLQLSAGILACQGNLSGFASGTVASGASLRPNGSNTYANIPLTITGYGASDLYGALYFSNGGSAPTVIWPGAITLGSGGAMIRSFGITYNTTLSGVIGGTGPLNLQCKGGDYTAHTGIFTLSTNCTYSGNTTFMNNGGDKEGTLKLGINDALPTGTVLTLSMYDNNPVIGVTFDLNGKNQQLAGLAKDTAGASAKYRVLNSGSAATLTISNSAPATYDGLIGVSGRAGLSLVKLGTAALTLGGTNVYTGSTTISAGKLVGVVGGFCSNSAVSVAATFGNTATLGLSITNVTKQWICSSLTVNNAGTDSGLDFDFGTLTPSTSLAPLSVSGSVTFTTAPTVTVRSSSIPVSSGNGYPLIVWGGSAPSLTGVTLVLASRLAGNLAIVGNTLYLQITVNNSSSPLSWAGGSGTWDINNSGNDIWRDSAVANTYYQETVDFTDPVRFDDTIGSGGTVTLDSIVNPASVTVSNTAANYVVSGSGMIAGSASLTKSGAGQLLLSTTNTFSGGTVINDGVLTLGVAGAIADKTVLTVNGGALDMNNQTLTVSALNGTGGSITNTTGLTVSNLVAAAYAGVITGGGSLTKSGPNNLTLSGNNSYTGVTTIASGILTAVTLAHGGANSSIGASASAAEKLVFAGGTLSYSGTTATSDRSFTINPATNATFDVPSELAILTLTGSAPTTTGFLKKTGVGTLALDPGTGSYSVGAISADGGILTLKSGTFIITGIDPAVSAYGVGAGARGGKLVVDGATLRIPGTSMLKIGANASGNMDILSGTVSVAYACVMGHNGTVTATQSGGDVSVLNLHHYDGGAATYTLTDGILKTSSIYNYSQTPTGTFKLILNGGVLRAAAGTVNLIANGGRVNGIELIVQLGTIGATIDTSLSNATIVRPLDDIPGQAGRLTKIGANTLTLSGTNTYTGATVVSNGVLRLTHAMALSGGADVYIAAAAGATLFLDYQGTNTIRRLYVDGQLLTKDRVYGANWRPTVLTGTGYLLTTEGRPKGTLIMMR